MRPGQLLMLIVVGGSGLAAGLLFYSQMTSQPDPNKGKLPVLATTQPVKRGDFLELGKNVEFKLIAEADISEEAYRHDEKLDADLKAKKMMATDNIPRNATVMKANASDSPNGLMEAMLKQYPGHQAFSMSVTTDKVASGFIKPNSRVDLYWTGRLDMKKDVTKVLLSDVPVLAVDLDNQVGNATVGREVRYMTFACKPNDVARLSFAMGKGSINAALRAAGQTSLDTATDIDANSLFAASKQAVNDEKMSDADAEELEKDGRRLVDTLAAVLAASTKPLPEAPKAVAGPTTVATPVRRRGPVWLMFDLKGAEGNVISKVPMPADGEFAKANRGLLREPEPEELESIAKLEAARPRGL